MIEKLLFAFTSQPTNHPRNVPYLPDIATALWSGLMKNIGLPL